MANQNDWHSQPGHTMQGLYAAAPDGTSYGWLNDRSIENLNALLDRALREFRSRPESEASAEPEAPSPWRSRSPDPSTAVIRVFSRIRPLPRGAAPLNRSVGRDHLWIYEDEARAMLAAPAGGEAFELPETLAARMVRFHLIDNVRGEPDFWKPAEVRKARFVARAAGEEGTVRRFTFSGEFGQSLEDGSRGQEG